MNELNISATCDVKRGIYDLACNKFDTQIAIVENIGEFSSIQESCVRLYDVGRQRDDEDEADEDDDEEDLDASDDDGSNSASDDNNVDGKKMISHYLPLFLSQCFIRYDTSYIIF